MSDDDPITPAALARDGRPDTLEERCLVMLIEATLRLTFTDHVPTVTPTEGRLVGGVLEVRLVARRPMYACRACGGERRLTAPCDHVSISPAALDLVRERFGPADRAPFMAVRVDVHDELAAGEWRRACDLVVARVRREAAFIAEHHPWITADTEEGNTQ